jgi:ABC-type branched-subunit amino acid transport system ATPase component
MLWKFAIKLFLKYNKENPMIALFNIIFIATSLISSYYLPNYYGKLFDIFNKDIDAFLTAILYILILNGIVLGIGEFEEYYLVLQENKLEEMTNKSIMDTIREQFLNNPEEVVIGEKIAVLVKFKEVFKTWYDYSINYILPYFLTIIIFAGFLFQYDYILPVLLVIFLSLCSFLLIANSRLCNDKSINATNSFLNKYQQLEDYLTNLLTIHTYNEFVSEDLKLNKNSIDYQEKTIEIEKCSLKWCLIGTILVVIFLLLLMYRSFKLLMNNRIGKGVFLSIYFISMGLVQTLVYLNDIFQEISKEYTALTVMEKSSQLNIFNKIEKPKVNINQPRIETDSFIKVVNLGYKYNSSNTYIIENLNLDIKKGERIALVGDIGAGKSTLLKILLGLLKPSKGDVFINGRNYKTLKNEDIFKRIGYMTQNPVLFNRSIVDNILFGNPNSTREEVIELLEEFNLNVVFNRLEKGIDTPVGKNGSKLSGGQRQVVWFLRIYLHNPEILIMDEPTASLSSESKEQLWKLIKRGFSDKTIIMASHDDFLIKLATRKVSISGYNNNNNDNDNKNYIRRNNNWIQTI